MPEHSESQSDGPPLALKDPLWAGVLAWLVPGLGHAYQGRYPKAVLFFVVILGTYFYGLHLGSDTAVGWGRVVYFSLRKDDVRWSYFGQVGVGLPALPALIQADLMHRGKAPLWHALMAPPKLKDSDPPALDAKDPGQRTLHEVLRHLDHYFELGTVYTVIAGLLNILAVYDACCGPVPPEPAKKKEDDDAPEGRKDKAEEPA